MMITMPIIITVAVLLVLALVTPLFCPFFRKVRLDEALSGSAEERASDSTAACPPVTIIITVHDNAGRLEEVMDNYLSQRYQAEFQLVVVIDDNDAESENVLKKRVGDPHLYYTKLPMSSRYLSRKKLAITIGMRAAKYQWCIITSVYCCPEDDQWLASFASYMEENKNMVIGLTPYDEEASGYKRYEQLRTMLYHIRTAQRGMAFSTNQSLVAIHRDEFFAKQGMLGNLKYQRAEYEFIVNKYANHDATAVALSPSSWLTFRRPAKKQWYYRHMYAIDSFGSLKRTFPFRFIFHLDMVMMHLYNVITFVTFMLGILMTLGALGVVPTGQIPLQLPLYDSILLLAASVVLWMVSNAIRLFVYAPVLRYFDNVHPLAAMCYDWVISLKNLFVRLKYKRMDRYDFMTHRL